MSNSLGEFGIIKIAKRDFDIQQFKMKKGQVFTADMIFGVIVFLIALAAALHLWQTTYDELRSSQESYEMNWLSETVSEQLVRTPGDPYNWTDENAITYGLAATKGPRRTVESRVLDADKILNFIKAAQEDYAGVRNRLLGSSRYDLWVQFSCVNRTDLTCLQGLPTHLPSGPINCAETTLTVDKNYTGSYLWFEGEELFGRYMSDENFRVYCKKTGCSHNNMSAVDDASAASVETNPGDYKIWVRTLEDYSDARIVVNGKAFPMHKLGVRGLVGWNHVGTLHLDSETNIGFSKTVPGTFVDAILLSNDGFYDPRRQNINFFGNPNIVGVCTVGDTQRGSDILSATRTAVIGVGDHISTENEQGRPNDRVVQVRVVLWRGTEESTAQQQSAPSTSTTTTLPVDLRCTGTPGEDCSAYNAPVIFIDDIKTWGPPGEENIIRCSGTTPSTKDVTVFWQGNHGGDPNYFGFYIDDGSGLVGSCESDNSAAEESGVNYNYVMNCSLTIPSKEQLHVSNGLHDLIVTGEDYLGYCTPYDPRSDSEQSVTVDVEDCLDYTVLTAGEMKPSYMQTICSKEGTVESIHKVSVPSGTITCDKANPVINPVTVYWGGMHGEDKQVQWTYLIKNGDEYDCIASCKSTVDEAESQTQYYQMGCDISPDGFKCDSRGDTYSIPDGDYELYVIGESDGNNYCANPDGTGDNAPEAVGTATVHVSGCG